MIMPYIYQYIFSLTSQRLIAFNYFLNGFNSKNNSNIANYGDWVILNFIVLKNLGFCKFSSWTKKHPFRFRYTFKMGWMNDRIAMGTKFSIIKLW